MKKLLIILSIGIVSMLTACKTPGKKETPIKQQEKTLPFSLKKAKNNINFTAYKTTEKVPVKGLFKTVEILKAGDGKSIKEAINGVEFKVPISGIETNDSSRNFKIQKFFFDVMENTFQLTGKLVLENDTKGYAEFTMNGITEKLPFDYTIEGKTFSLNTVMDINKWNGQKAVASLNEACKELHKGADGISKTWSKVAISIVSTF